MSVVDGMDTTASVDQPAENTVDSAVSGKGGYSGPVAALILVGLLGIQMFVLSGWFTFLVKTPWSIQYNVSGSAATAVGWLSGIEATLFRGTTQEVPIVLPTILPMLVAAGFTALISNVFSSRDEGSVNAPAGKLLSRSLFVIFYGLQFCALTVLHWNHIGL